MEIVEEEKKEIMKEEVPLIKNTYYIGKAFCVMSR
jgi:hypothetical protein